MMKVLAIFFAEDERDRVDLFTVREAQLRMKQTGSGGWGNNVAGDSNMRLIASKMGLFLSGGGEL